LEWAISRSSELSIIVTEPVVNQDGEVISANCSLFFGFIINSRGECGSAFILAAGSAGECAVCKFYKLYIFRHIIGVPKRQAKEAGYYRIFSDRRRLDVDNIFTN
jgi:hypothetical protein